MPFYKNLKRVADPAERKRTIENLLALRQKAHAEIPRKTASDTLLLATWNIREFKSGARLNESYYYIAEIISKFDLVAVQEVANDLEAIEKILYILGRNWNYIATDSTEGSAGGMERNAFIYDTNKVEFMRIAGEVVMPDKELIDGKQFARTPFTVAFQAGWFKFMLTSVHIFFGEGTEGMARRIKEIETISLFLSKRAKKENQSYILLGDFNILSPTDPTFMALKKGGFHVPEEILISGSDIKKEKYYDQIAFKLSEGKDMVVFDKDEKESRHAGVFNFFDTVFKEDQLPIYKKYFSDEILEKNKDDKKLNTYYKSKYRTFQMSDHLVRWVSLKINFSDEYLNQLLTAPAPDVNDTLDALRLENNKKKKEGKG